MKANIKNIAYGIAHKFSVSSEYFAYLALSNNINKIKIDLLKIDVEPELFLIERNLTLIRYCSETLQYYFNKLENPPEIIEAFLYVEFDLLNKIENNGFYKIPAIFTTNITNGNNKKYSATLKENIQIII